MIKHSCISGSRSAIHDRKIMYTHSIKNNCGIMLAIKGMENMAIYAISDLHLDIGIPSKNMNVFGSQWENYVERLDAACSKLTENDILLIPGDISWATYLQQSLPDFAFLEKWKPIKLISKGNHDYWWTTASKLNAFREENQLKSIHFLHNSFYPYKEFAICANRGWITPGMSGFSAEDRKIYARELIRLELSLNAAQQAGFERKIVMTHYPPAINSQQIDEAILALLKKYDVEQCIYGHLHGKKQGDDLLDGLVDEIMFHMVSSDYLQFQPIKIME
mgnify:CR=1 FL=1